MPYINLKTNAEIADKNELRGILGELICKIPNKTEARTMMLIDDRQDMFFGGSAEACAMVETLVNQGTDQSNIRDYGLAVIETLSAKLNIPENRIYVTVNAVDNWISK